MSNYNKWTGILSCRKIQQILLLVLLWQLSGCSTLDSAYFKKFLRSEVACQEPPVYHPGILGSITWYPLSGMHERRFMALTGEDYKTLAKNGVIMEKALRQSYARTVHYKDCIKRHNATEVPVEEE